MSSCEENKIAKCSVCSDIIDKTSRTTVICSNIQCNAVSHLQCLANKFLDEEHSENLIIPVMGNCPSCRAGTSWTELVTGLSKRIHGFQDFNKTKKITKGKTKQIQADLKKAKHDLVEKISPNNSVVNKEQFSEGQY